MSLPYVIQELKKPQMSEPIETTESVISLPNTVSTNGYGQVSVTLKGETLNQVADTDNWIVDSGSNVDNRVVMLVADGNRDNAFLPVNLNTNTEYTIILQILSHSITTDGSLFLVNQDWSTFGGGIWRPSHGVGEFRFKFTSASEVPSNKRIRMVLDTSIPDGEQLKFKVKAILQGDWTAGEKANRNVNELKYGVNSTVSMRLRAPKKNLVKDLELGSLSAATGILLSATNRYRTKLIKLDKGQTFTRSLIAGYKHVGGFLLFNSNGDFVKQEGSSNTLTFTTDGDYLLRLVYAKNDGSNLSSDDLNKLQLERGSVATAIEPYSDTNMYIQLDEPLRSVGNAKDEIRPTANGDEHVKRVSDDIVLTGNEAWTELTTDTNTYRARIVNWAIGKNAILGVVGSINARSADGSYESTGESYQDKRNIRIRSADNSLWVTIEKTKIDAMVGATTLEKWKAYLNQFPITLTYQFAQSLITPLPPMDKLIAYPNGSIFIEPFTKITKTYGSGIATDLPIKSIESIFKIKDNIKTPVDLSKVTSTITDQESTVEGYYKYNITIDGATTNDLYEVVYEYPQEISTLPTVSISYPINVASAISSNTNMITNISKQVIDLNDFTVAMLLNHETRMTLLEQMQI